MLVRYFAALLVAGIRATSAFVVTEPSVAWKTMTPGWNLGNTLDGIPTEGFYLISILLNFSDDDLDGLQGAGRRVGRNFLIWPGV